MVLKSINVVNKMLLSMPSLQRPKYVWNSIHKSVDRSFSPQTLASKMKLDLFPSSYKGKLYRSSIVALHHVSHSNGALYCCPARFGETEQPLHA